VFDQEKRKEKNKRKAEKKYYLINKNARPFSLIRKGEG